MRRKLLVAFGLLLFIIPFGLSQEAQGHAEYASSDPPTNWVLTEPPTRLTVTVTEAIQPGTQKLRVTNSTGTSFDPGTVQISEANPRRMTAELQGLGPGVYTVTWSVISAVDGHFTAGSFSFGVLNPDGTLPGTLPVAESGAAERVGSVPEIALRFLSLLGLAAAFGATVFLSSVWRPVWATGRRKEDSEPPAYAQGTRELLSLGRLASLVFVAGVAGWWGLTLFLAPPASASDLIVSQFLLSLALRLVLGVALVVILSITLSRVAAVTSPRRPSPWMFVALLLGLAAVVAGSFGSHGAAATTLSPLGTVADAAHLLGVSLWVGGLFAVVRVRRHLRDDDTAREAVSVLRLFSRLAFFAIGIVLVAGLALSVILVGTLEGLFGTRYGWVVLGKVSLFVPMVALGGYNRYRLLPSPDPTETVKGVSRNVRVEVLLGATVLAVAGLLTSMSPALSLSGGDGGAPLSLSATDQGIRMDMDIIPYPTLPGIYVFSLLLFDADTEAAYDRARNATLTLTHLDSGLPPQEVSLPGPHGNHFGGESPALSQSGDWRLDLRLTRLDGFDLRATFQITVGGS
ncbi:MAG: copper resistance CopC/CopD family protein [Thermoplasmata archaeon]